MDINERRQAEKRLYDKLYQKNYGGSNHARYALDKIKSMNIYSLIDVGCGQGHFCDWAVRNGVYTVLGADVSSDFKEANTKATYYNCFAHELPITDNSVEWVMSFDMLEHILPEDTDKVLNEFKRVATKGFFLSISYTKSVIEVDGKNLHPNVHPKKWWKEKLSEYGNVEEYYARYLIVTF